MGYISYNEKRMITCNHPEVVKISEYGSSAYSENEFVCHRNISLKMRKGGVVHFKDCGDGAAISEAEAYLEYYGKKYKFLGYVITDIETLALCSESGSKVFESREDAINFLQTLGFDPTKYLLIAANEEVEK